MKEYDVNRTQASLPSGFLGCIEIFKMARDGHESHALIVLFLFFVQLLI